MALIRVGPGGRPIPSVTAGAAPGSPSEGSSISSAMLTELRGQARIHYTMDLGLDATYRFAKSPVASESNGLYLPDVRTFGTIQRGIGYPSFGLQDPRVTVGVIDRTRVLQKAIGGPRRGDVIGSPASIIMRSFYVDATNHYTILSGEVKDFRINSGEDRAYTIVIGPNLSTLTSKLNIPRLTNAEWQRIPSENRDGPGRIILGVWDSTSRSNVGLIPCPFVDTQFPYHYLCYGHLPAGSVTGVWKLDGTSKTADFTQANIIKNGHPYTMVQQTGDLGNVITESVNVDCTGLGDVGDGSGSVVVEEPAEALRLVLANFVYGEWPKDAAATASGFQWLSNTSDIDATSFSDADTYFLNVRHFRHVGIFTSDQTALDVIGQWIQTFQCPVFWSDELKIKIGFFDLAKRNIYTSTFVRQDKRQVRQISMESFGEERKSRVTVSYMPDLSGGRFDRSFLAANEDLSFMQSETLDLPLLGPSQIT